MAGGILRKLDRLVSPGREREPRKRKPVGALGPMGARETGGAVMRDDGFPVIDGPHYLDVLRGLHERLNPAWYFEIGAFKGHSLAQARCDVVAVDPEFRFAHPVLGAARRGHFFQMTSEAFFAEGFLEQAGIIPDLAFLDGLHHYEALLEDFIATEARMAPGGVIVLHDCAPTDHLMAEREWPATSPAWTGDVWKTLAALIEHRPDLRIDVLDAWPSGLVAVRALDPGNRALPAAMGAIRRRFDAVSLADFGVARYFGMFEIMASARFVAGLPDRGAA